MPSRPEHTQEEVFKTVSTLQEFDRTQILSLIRGIRANPWFVFRVFFITFPCDLCLIAPPIVFPKMSSERTREIMFPSTRPHADIKAMTALANPPPSGISSSCNDIR